METIIARQPIFNFNKRLHAYELLYRGVKSLSLDAIGGDRATTSLLSSAFLTEGIEKISHDKPCFINFTEKLLVDNIVANFPKTKVVVEILEDVKPTKEVIAACRELKKAGYTLALDDFIFDPILYPLIELADIVKFDLRLTPVEMLHKALHYIKHYDVKLLAEKVETHDEFNKAVKLGFTYFQGYFFAKPEVMRIRELASSELHLLSLLAEINKSEISTKKLTDIIASDVSLSYKLLKYINSAYFYLVKEVESVQHAISYLGTAEIRRFVSLAIISKLSTKKTPELMKLATIRAKFCEQLGLNSDWMTNPEELFLLGLFSLLHAMLDTSMDAIVENLPLTDELKLALTGKESPLSPFLTTAICYEKGRQEEYSHIIKRIEVEASEIPRLYIDAVQYADTIALL